MSAPPKMMNHLPRCGLAALILTTATESARANTSVTSSTIQAYIQLVAKAAGACPVINSQGCESTPQATVATRVGLPSARYSLVWICTTVAATHKASDSSPKKNRIRGDEPIFWCRRLSRIRWCMEVSFLPERERTCDSHMARRITAAMWGDDREQARGHARMGMATLTGCATQGQGHRTIRRPPPALAQHLRT